MIVLLYQILMAFNLTHNHFFCCCKQTNDLNVKIFVVVVAVTVVDDVFEIDVLLQSLLSLLTH